MPSKYQPHIDKTKRYKLLKVFYKINLNSNSDDVKNIWFCSYQK
jgi:hypothetical protein